MTRDSLTGSGVATSTDQAQPSAPTSGTTQNGAKPNSAVTLMQDALAGSLPAWDLLPAAPFIRRVR
jgi:hypothetical protein